MRRVLWTDSARDDYLGILRHIAEDDPDAAERVVHAIQRTGKRLGDFATGHPGRVAGTYEKSVRSLPYIIAYALTDDERAVTILRVIHSARAWPTDRLPD